MRLVYLQIQWVEEQYEIFALELRQIDFLEFTVDDGGTGKRWGWLVESRHDGFFLRNRYGNRMLN